MKSAIVTGANGFIGSAIVKELICKGVEVTAIVHNNNSKNIDQLRGVNIISCDNSEVFNLENVLSKRSYDVFYYISWDGSSGSKREDYALQLSNVKNLLDAICVSNKIGCKRFIVSGTIMEDETIGAVNTPGNHPNVSYIYGAGKVAAHLMSAPLASSLNIDLIWAKITNAYGPGEYSPRLINTTIRKCLKKISPEFTSGTQNYDFIYIDDLAKAFYLLGEKGIAFKSYVIGSSNAKPLREFLLELKDSVAPDIDFIFGNVPYSGTNLPLRSFDTSELEKDTGFKASISFKEGCIRTKQWLELNGD